MKTGVKVAIGFAVGATAVYIGADMLTDGAVTEGVKALFAKSKDAGESIVENITEGAESVMEVVSEAADNVMDVITNE